MESANDAGGTTDIQRVFGRFMGKMNNKLRDRDATGVCLTVFERFKTLKGHYMTSKASYGGSDNVIRYSRRDSVNGDDIFYGL